MNIQIVGGVLFCQTDEINDIWSPLTTEQFVSLEKAIVKSKELNELY